MSNSNRSGDSRKRSRQDDGNDATNKRQKGPGHFSTLLNRWTEEVEHLSQKLDRLEKYAKYDGVGLTDALEYVAILRGVCDDVASGDQAPTDKLLPLFSTPLSEYFSSANPDALPKVLRITLLSDLELVQNKLTTIFEILSEILGGHSLRSEERAAAIRKLAIPPSAAATTSQLVITQDPENLGAIHNGRPHTLTGPSLSIYHPIFQEFMQQYSSPIDLSDSREYTQEDFVAASALNSRCAEYFKSEDARHAIIRPLLEHFLGRGAASRTKVASGEELFAPDGYLEAKVGLYRSPEFRAMCTLIFELEPGIGSGKCDPNEQAQFGYLLFSTDPALEKLRKFSCMPTFLLSMAGSHIKISGAIYIGGVVSASLTDYQDLVPSLQVAQLDAQYANPHDAAAWRTVHTLRALRRCLDKLKQEYADMREETMREDPLRPAPHFKKFSSQTGDVELTYLSHLLGNPCSDRSVFLADAITKSKTVKCVVKFTPRYCKRAHEIMAGEGVAPELLYCSWEKSVGLWVVITKYYDVQRDTMPSEDGLAKLRHGLEALHKENLVHGDVRFPNILVDSNGHPWIVDFDWSGKIGIARYPASLNTNEWPKDILPGTLIEVNHDIRMFDRYVERIQTLLA